ncbi:MAG: HEAT repeat domain-containing protein [Leptospiraceae bacterium]|nr:HEAT repeat domain-containing protein [Leptospiraceae bacterium]MCK6381958.1 HEAT repeat domain-containing protein [Leptospiraceae bacterium]NUM40296.1 HEAT repeat domain-containing protein [Leptospiraceae bacterium]
MKKKIASYRLTKIFVIFVFFFGISLPTFSQKNPEKQDAVDSEKSLEDSENKEISKIKKPNEKKLTPEQLTKKKEILEKILKFGSTKERKEALRELWNFPKEYSSDLYKVLPELLNEDPDISIKIATIKTISELELTSENKSIINSLSNESDDVKEAAVYAIHKLKIDEACTNLLDILKSKDFSKNTNLTSSIISTLGELPGGKNAYQFLEAKFIDKTSNADIRAQIVLFFGKIKDLRSEKILLEAVENEDEEIVIRAYSMNSLGKINSQSSIAPLKKILKKIKEVKGKAEIKKYSPLKIYGISALALLGDKDILKELFVYAKDDDTNVRIRAIKQLGEIKSKEALELLEYKAKRDPSPKVQAAAKKAIEEINGTTEKK